MLCARVFVDCDQRVRPEDAFKHVIDRWLDPFVIQRHVQHERPVQVRGFADVVFDIGAVIGDRAVDIGTAAQHVTKLAAEAVPHSTGFYAAGIIAEEFNGFLHILDAIIVVELVIEIECLRYVVGV